MHKLSLTALAREQLVDQFLALARDGADSHSTRFAILLRYRHFFGIKRNNDAGVAAWLGGDILFHLIFLAHLLTCCMK